MIEPDAFQVALEQSARRGTRQLNRLRPWGVSSSLAVFAVMGIALDAPT